MSYDELPVFSRTDSPARARGRTADRERRRVHSQGERCDGEDLHFAGQLLLCGGRGGQRCLSGILHLVLLAQCLF